MPKCCDDKNNDIESVNAWLRKDAPDESSRPDVPIDTNIPDPALLPEAPPLYRRLPRFCAWIFREPLAALVHAVAFACCLVALFALLRPMLARETPVPAATPVPSTPAPESAAVSAEAEATGVLGAIAAAPRRRGVRFALPLALCLVHPCVLARRLATTDALHPPEKDPSALGQKGGGDATPAKDKGGSVRPVRLAWPRWSTWPREGAAAEAKAAAAKGVAAS